MNWFEPGFDGIWLPKNEDWGVEPSEKGIDLMNKWRFHPEEVGCSNWLTIKNDEKIEIQLPSGYVKIAIENHHFQWVNPL